MSDFGSFPKSEITYPKSNTPLSVIRILDVGCRMSARFRNPKSHIAAKALIARLGEIKAMDKTNLKASEKKQLRNETRSIKRELRKLSGGVYFSVGAIIVILILLILMLK